jgi:MFS family permease
VAETRTDHLGVLPRKIRKGSEERWFRILRNPALVMFAGCMALFQLGNAAMLPIAANAITRAGGQGTDLVVAACIIVSQVLAAWLSPFMGRAAQRWGRRPVLLVGLAALPLRAFLFAVGGHPYLLVAFQALDGISASVIGMIIPLVVSDITRRRGRFNLAMGMVGFAVGIGATFSTGLAGTIADRLGESAAFGALAAAGIAACAMAWFWLPETAPSRWYKKAKSAA